MKSQAKWVVTVDKQRFVFNEAEYQLLKKAALAGKTMVWFDTVVISIPHISYMEKIKEHEHVEIPKLPEPDTQDFHKHIGEMRRKWSFL